jgi:hypothetical protein
LTALGRVVLAKRERVIMLQPWDKGLTGTTLRYPYEIRDAKEYFEDIPNVELEPDMLTLPADFGRAAQGARKATPKPRPFAIPCLPRAAALERRRKEMHMFQLRQLTVLRTSQPRAHKIALAGCGAKIGKLGRLALAEAIQKRCMIDDPAITRVR